MYEYAVARALLPYAFSLTRTGRAADNGIDLLGCWHVPSAPAPLPVLLQCKRHARPLGPEHVRALQGAFASAPSAWSRAGDGAPGLGLLVGPKPATRGVRDAVGASAWPVGYLMVEDTGSEAEEMERSSDDVLAAAAAVAEGSAATAVRARRDAPLGPPGRVLQFIWNEMAQQRGLEGLGVTMRYSTPSASPATPPGPTTPPFPSKPPSPTLPPPPGAGASTEREIVLTWNGRAIGPLPGDDPAGAPTPVDWPAADLARGLAGAAPAAAEAAGDAGAETQQVKKKRGRPRKTTAEPPRDDAIKAGQAHGAEEAAAEAIAASAKAAARKAKKPRPVGQKKKT